MSVDQVTLVCGDRLVTGLLILIPASAHHSASRLAVHCLISTVLPTPPRPAHSVQLKNIHHFLLLNWRPPGWPGHYPRLWEAGSVKSAWSWSCYLPSLPGHVNWRRRGEAPVRRAVPCSETSPVYCIVYSHTHARNCSVYSTSSPTFRIRFHPFCSHWMLKKSFIIPKADLQCKVDEHNIFTLVTLQASYSW